MTPVAPEEASLLRWYRASGVETLVEETPANFYARNKQPPARRAPAQRASALAQRAPALASPVADRREAPKETGEPVEAARGRAVDIARNAESLDALRRALEAFEACELRKTAHNLVFADGNPQSRIMLIGEAPGAEEDRRGLPFVGRSGQLLDRMLAAIGLDRRQVYITNVLPWRPPGNRVPSDLERAQCRPFLDRHIELIDPALLVMLGGVAAKEMLGTAQGIMKLRGRWLEAQIGEKTYPVLPTLHPAYLLRQPGQKALAWRDFRLLRARAEGIK